MEVLYGLRGDGKQFREVIPTSKRATRPLERFVQQVYFQVRRKIGGAAVRARRMHQGDEHQGVDDLDAPADLASESLWLHADGA